MAETIATIVLHRKPHYTAAQISAILDKRGLNFEGEIDGMSELLNLEPMLDLFGQAEGEKLKNELTTCKNAAEELCNYVEQKIAYQA